MIKIGDRQMKRLLAVLSLGLTAILLGSCINSKNTTENTFGYDCWGDMLIVSYISEDSDDSYWKLILDAVNEYRNSSDYAKDDSATRGEKIEEILADFEGKYIVEGSIEHDSDHVSGKTMDGATFTIGIHDLDWYAER